MSEKDYMKTLRRMGTDGTKRKGKSKKYTMNQICQRGEDCYEKRKPYKNLTNHKTYHESFNAVSQQRIC